MEVKSSPFPNRSLLAFIGWIALTVKLAGQTTNVSVSAVPDWVRLCDWSPETNREASQKTEGSRYLLFERQESLALKENFTRVVLRMENQTGVQDSGSLSFGFDPSFQELILNRVAIHRDGKALERLDRSKVKIIQPEPDLDGHVFTGRQTAVLFVEDLRVGDALEYAYTIRGANPILQGHYAGRFVVQRSVPLERERLRLVWPATKQIYLRQHLLEAQPTKTTRHEMTEQVWDFTNLVGIAYEDAVPVSYEPFPYVEVSDFDNWTSVVEWARPLYANETSNAPPELVELAANWKGKATSNEERARLALDFVQDELRYTGLELGPDSYRPALPSDTFRLRYGDCKAKARLLCALLGEMNLEAYPALVNTSARETVATRLPSPFAFDHAIVKLLLDGQAVWIDPTRSQQGGRVWERHLSPLGKALVIKGGVASLEDIPPAASKSRERVTSTFTLKDYQSPASLTVRTTYYGSEADRMRPYFARTDKKEISKDFLNFYARYYPGVQSPGPLEVTDERLGNVLEVTEHYQIRELWKLNKAEQKWEAVFYADALEDMLTDPQTRIRKMPLGLAYPSRREQEVVIHLPDKDWNIGPADQTVDCEAFSFHYRRAMSGSTIECHYDCETRCPTVPADQVGGYLKKFEEMHDLLGDTLYRPDERPAAVLAQLNWLMVVVAGFGSAAALLGGFWYWRASRSMPQELAPPLPAVPPAQAHLQGLRGWLILVGFGLIMMLLWRPIDMLRNWRGFFSMASWQIVAVPGGEQYHPLYGPLLIFEVLGNTLLIGLNVLACCLFFAKRKAFPRVYIALLVITALFVLTDEVLGNQIPSVVAASHNSSSTDVGRTIVQALIWCSYMVLSKRVKATFVW